MKLYSKFFALLLSVCLSFCVFVGCTDSGNDTGEATTAPGSTTTGSNTDNGTPVEAVDYVAQLKLDMNTSSLKQKVTVKTFIDGDTTHFNVPTSLIGSSVLKARYLAINTPESTGTIEEFGKRASRFTKEKLSSASSIIIESDDGNWNADSTGGRYLVWVWYRTSETEDYRNLNLEILQNGLAIASSSANNRYGETCMAAIDQARTQKLYVYSGEKDPDMFYGDALELTLKELRCNIDEYNGKKVAFNGVITKDSNNSVYVEDYDSETDMYYGISIYYGYSLSGDGLTILSVGNLARIVGTVQYYEAGGTYQVSDVSYRIMKPNDPSNLQLISTGNEAAFREITTDTFVNGTVSVTDEDSTENYKFAELAMNTSVSMKNLYVKSVYTTNNPDSASNGAMTLTCTADGITVSVRTDVLRDADGNLVTASAYEGKNIDVKGLVDYYNGSYQINVLSAKDITIIN